MDLGHWQCESQIPKDCYGFIYKITNNITDRMYIGKKQMVQRITRPPLKGKKNKRRLLCESDWKTYTGSCRELNKDIEKLGIENFSFIILRLCYNKSQLAYYEVKEQVQRDVLLKDEYYNGMINCRIGKINQDGSKFTST